MNVMSMTSTDVDSTFNLTLDVLREAALTCSVTDLGGKEYDTFQFQAINGVNKISVNFENFTPGMYKFNVRLGEETESFVLQRMLDNRMSNPQTAGTKTFKNAKGRQ